MRIRASATAVELDIISAPMSLKMTDVAVMSNRLTLLIYAVQKRRVDIHRWRRAVCSGVRKWYIQSPFRIENHSATASSYPPIQSIPKLSIKSLALLRVSESILTITIPLNGCPYIRLSHMEPVEKLAKLEGPPRPQQ